jgi:thermitase
VEEAAGAELAEDMPDIDAQVVEFPEVKGDASQNSREGSLEEMKSELEDSPGVEEVYYNYVRTGTQATNDPRFGQQYGLRKTGFPTAWKRHPRGVKVAVVDSGVAAGHPDLRGKVVAGYDFHNNNASVEDLNGHGTHIAGIIAAKTSNGVGVASGCPKCTIVAAKALDKNLSGFDSNIARAINWSVNNGAKVVNLSLGSDEGEKSVLKRSIDYARSKGAVVVVAGGNYGDNRRVWPAVYDNVVSVSYTDARDVRSRNSSFGGWIDMAAPGVNIVSTVPGGYQAKSGSSFSAPHAAALAGVLLGQNRSPGIVIRRMKLTANDIGPRGRDAFYGYGRINAERASRR